MTSKLTLYNGALRLLKERPLASLAENREPRRLLDSAWDGGAIDYCLEEGLWKFAKRTVQIDASPSIDPDFGYEFAFDIPTDHKGTAGIWSDEMLTQPFRDYREESGYWYGSLETMYVSYISNDAQYGLDLSLWPQTFVKFVEAHLASEVAGPMTEAGKEMLQLRERLLRAAKSSDAQGDPTRVIPAGSWVRARIAGRTRRTGQP